MKLDKEQKIIISIVIISVLLVCACLGRHKDMTVTFLDVGDGLCVVAKSPAGKIMVFDCGNSNRYNNGDVGRNTAASYLQKIGADHIDIAVLSHPHFDHMCGYSKLFARKRPYIVMNTAYGDSSPEYSEFLRAVRRSGADYKIAKCGDVIDLGGGAAAKILGPSKRFQDANDNSTVMRLTYGSSSVLLTGDAGCEAEEDMLRRNVLKKAEVLQVGHHGSKTATSEEFVKKIRPDAAVVSCKYNSNFGYPAEEVKLRLRKFGTKMYTTASNGNITVICKKNRLKVVPTYK